MRFPKSAILLEKRSPEDRHFNHGLQRARLSPAGPFHVRQHRCLIARHTAADTQACEPPRPRVCGGPQTLHAQRL